MSSELWYKWELMEFPMWLDPQDHIDLIAHDGREYHGWPAGPNFVPAATRPSVPFVSYFRPTLFPGSQTSSKIIHTLPLPSDMVAPEYRQKDVVDWVLAYQDHKYGE